MNEQITVRVGQPYFSDSDISEIESGVSRVLRSGWLTSGQVAVDFEQKFADIIGTRYAIAVNSGTAALHTLTSALNLDRHDEVVVPANTFVATVNAVLYVRARPVLVDCHLETFNVTAENIERGITPHTKAVMVTHVGGNPCEMDDIIQLCRERDLVLIEDAAHAHGSKYRGKACGSFGFGGAFSFYPTKVITSGEGGMITTDSQRLCEYAKAFRNMGRKRVGHGPILALGQNYRMSEIHAVVGTTQLKHLREFVQKRNELSRIYDEELSRLDWLEPQVVHEHSISSRYAYIVMLSRKRRIARDSVMESLTRNGIETTVMFTPVHMQPYYKHMFTGVKCPNAELIGTAGLVLPLHVGMGVRDVESVVEALRKLE